MRIVALDVGNTSVAAAAFDGAPGSTAPAGSAHRVRGASETGEIEWWRGRVGEWRPDQVAIGSVHGFGSALAQALAERHPVRLLDRGDRFPLASDAQDPAAVGVDRLAAALAAARIAGGAALVVCAGTAITADWVDEGPRFRGGAIVPGRRLQALALHEFTDRLPAIEPWPAEPVLRLPGRSSEEAIRHGLDAGIPGQVEALLRELTRAAGRALPVLVGGGDAAWLGSRLRREHRLEPLLAARGIAIAALLPARSGAD